MWFVIFLKKIVSQLLPHPFLRFPKPVFIWESQEVQSEWPRVQGKGFFIVMHFSSVFYVQFFQFPSAPEMTSPLYQTLNFLYDSGYYGSESRDIWKSQIPRIWTSFGVLILPCSPLKELLIFFSLVMAVQGQQSQQTLFFIRADD